MRLHVRRSPGHLLPELIVPPSVFCPQRAPWLVRNGCMETDEEHRQMEAKATAGWREHFFNWLALGVIVALGFV